MEETKKIDDLREKLRQFMYERDMTIVQASTFFGMSIGAVSKFLNKKTIPHARVRYRIRTRIGIKSEKPK